MLENDVAFFGLVLLVSLSMGVFVFLKNTKSKVNQSFLYLSMCISIWILSNYLEDVIKQPKILNLLLRADYAFGAAVIFYFFLFIGELVELKILKNKLVKIFLYLLIIGQTLLIFFTNFIVEGYEMLIGGLDPILGNGIIIYYVFLGLFLLLVTVTSLIKYKSASGDKKTQILYIFIGMFLTIIIAIITNIALVDYIKNSPNYTFYSRLGVYSVIFLNIFGGYAIIKHRLLNIKIISTELLALAVVIFSLVQLFTAERLSSLISQGIIFIVLSFFAYSLVRSVEIEIERKDELQKMSDELARANDQLRKLDNAKSDFISIASHQLRTPLTSIKGFISLLSEGSYGKITPVQQETLNKVYQSNERLIHLVEDLLDISRIESGRMEFDFAPCQLADLCQEVMDGFSIRAKNSKLYLDYKKPVPPLPEIMIDAGKVREVISNMVDNALKYTPKGGVKVKLEKKETNLRVTILDTGIGIPATELPYLFSKFSRGKDIGRLNAAGTGLGLYVGKSMIEANGGRIWAESEGEGKGSRFIIELPVKQSPEILAKWGK